MKAFLFVVFILLSHLIGNAQTIEGGASKKEDIKVERVFPNPINDHVFVEITSIKFAKAECELIDILGKPVQRWEAVELSPTTQKIRLNLNDFHSGLYLLKVKVGNEIFVTRIRKV